MTAFTDPYRKFEKKGQREIGDIREDRAFGLVRRLHRHRSLARGSGSRCRSPRAARAAIIPAVSSCAARSAPSAAASSRRKAATCGAGRLARSEARRVGKECVSTCRSRWSTDNSKNKKTEKEKTTQTQYKHTNTH